MIAIVAAVLLAAAAAWLLCGSGSGAGPRARLEARGQGGTPSRLPRLPAHGLGGQGHTKTLHGGSASTGPAPAGGDGRTEGGTPGEADTPLLLDVCAALLEAGLPVPRILDQLAANVPGCVSLAVVARSLDAGIGWDRAWARTPPALARLGASLAFAHLTGAPTAALLRSAAELERRSSLRSAERRAAELGVRLVVPLGVCVLPAFICLGIVPVVMSLLPGTG